MFTSLFKWYTDLPFTLRFIISFLIGSTIGSAFLAFVSNYATYWYAFRHGARIPIEGIPFLAPSIAILSFLLFALSTLGVAAAYLIIKGIAAFLKASVGAIFAWREKRSIGLQHAKGRHILLMLAFVWLTLLLYFFLISDRQLPSLFVTSGAASSLAIIILWRPVGMDRILAVFYIALTLAATAGMFVDAVYDTFLRWIRFGGGIEISLQRKDKEEVKAYLFLHTQDRVILYDPSKAGFFEVPTAEIEGYTYAQYPDWKLPSPSLREQGKYVRY